MTKPARGIFRAISSFARYVTPAAPGFFPLKTAQSPSMRESTQVSSQPPDSLGDQKPVYDEMVTSTPPLLTPAASMENLTYAIGIGQESLTSHDLPRSPMHSEIRLGRPVCNASSQQSSATSSKKACSGELSGTSPSLPLPAMSLGRSGDDAGPRFGDDSVGDTRALPGTAGHSGVYAGANVSIAVLKVSC